MIIHNRVHTSSKSFFNEHASVLEPIDDWYKELYAHANRGKMFAAMTKFKENTAITVGRSENHAFIFSKRSETGFPCQEISNDVLLEKYAEQGETSACQVRRRVAAALAKNESYMEEIFAATLEYFIPAGRINASAGVNGLTTLLNCFVQPIDDSATESTALEPTPIYTALSQAAETMRRGGGVGYNFSKIRPSGALVKGTNSTASGPVSYIRLFDTSCDTIESAGSRRGAQMGVLDCDHPDIFEFITAKSGGSITNFNLSVYITDEFMNMLEENKSLPADKKKKFALAHSAKPFNWVSGDTITRNGQVRYVYQWIDPQDLYDKIMENTYSHAEPGVLFADTINRNNNLYYAEELRATNPCAEQPLPDHGCCDLGSINLTKLVVNPFTDEARIDWDLFSKVIYFSVRMLDNVLDISAWPHPMQEKEANDKRRIGLGFTGLGNALAMLKVKYDSNEALEIAESIAMFMRNYAYVSSAILGEEKGAFPRYNAKKFFRTGIEFSIPHYEGDNGIDYTMVQRNTLAGICETLSITNEQLAAVKMRNSHLLSIAPTGTISLAFADNASNGIEPPFNHTYTRKKLEQDGTPRFYEVEDYAYRLYRHMFPEKANEPLPDYFSSALEISANAHLDMVIAVSPYICTAISKTVNVREDYPFEDFKDLYYRAWRSGTLKGLSTYRPNSVLGSVLSITPEKKADAQVPGKQEETQPLPRTGLAVAKPSLIGNVAIPVLPRPVFVDGNVARTYDLRGQGDTKILVTIGYREIRTAGNDVLQVPFEILATGNTENLLGAVLKNLSIDIRNGDWDFVERKLDAVCSTVSHVENVDYRLRGVAYKARSYMHAISAIIRNEISMIRPVFGVSPGDYSADQCLHEPAKLADMLFKVPAHGSTLTHTVSIPERDPYPAFDIHISKCVLDGKERVYRVSSTLSKVSYVSALMAALSLDARVENPKWLIGKLKKCIEYSESDSAVNGPVVDLEGSGYASTWYNSIAGLQAAFILPHVETDGNVVPQEVIEKTDAVKPSFTHGAECKSCGAYAVARADGCNRCTACGEIGSCG